MTSTNAASKLLLRELSKLVGDEYRPGNSGCSAKNATEGYLLDAEKCAKDLFKWPVSIFGPPDTLYAGGYFPVFENV